MCRHGGRPARRLRLVHRDRPAKVFLLSNLPTALPVDRFTTWAGVAPDKLEQAIVAGRGVLPLSRSELARAHPSLWATERVPSSTSATSSPAAAVRARASGESEPVGTLTRQRTAVSPICRYADLSERVPVPWSIVPLPFRSSPAACS